MSIVKPWIHEARILDLFAGSGALGLEALSRGAAAADFVDSSPRSLAAIETNAAALGAGAAAVIHRTDALRFIARLDAHAYDLAFVDPPYDRGLASRVAERWLAVPFADVIGIEHRHDEVLPGDGERRRYGDTVITLYGIER
jgi:16S rRNA (guanine966-N2)-methyltransferase